MRPNTTSEVFQPRTLKANPSNHNVKVNQDKTYDLF